MATLLVVLGVYAVLLVLLFAFVAGAARARDSLGRAGARRSRWGRRRRPPESPDPLIAGH